MNKFTYDILKCSSYYLLKVWLNDKIIINFFYEPGQYTDEYVKSTIIPTKLGLWANNVQVTEAFSTCETSRCKEQGSKEAQVGCGGYPHGRDDSKIWKPGE